MVVAVLGFAAGCAGRYDLGRGEEAGGEGGADTSLETGGTGTGGSGASVGDSGGAPDMGTGGLPSPASGGSDGTAGGGDVSNGGFASVGTGGAASPGGSGGTSAGSGGCPSAWDGFPEGPIASSELLWQRLGMLFYDEVSEAGPGKEINRDNIRDEAQNRILAISSLSAPIGLRRFVQEWLFADSEGGEELGAQYASTLFMHGGSFAGLFAPLDEEHRVSFLSEPAVLAAYPTFSTRGAYMSEKLFCLGPLGLPPVGHPTTPEPEPGQTSRQAYQALAGSPACLGCHNLIDSLGFSLEHFDAVGDYRDVDNSEPIDASGRYRDSRGDIEFADIGELAPWIGQSPDAAACLGRSLFRYAREYAVDRERLDLSNAEADAVACEFVESGFDPLTLVAAVVDTPSFLLE